MREYYYRNREKFREYRKTRRAETAAYQKAYQEQIPYEVRAARWALAYAIKRGWIVRPDRCQSCGTIGPVEGHHYKGYGKAFRLEVQWLCKPCHGAEQQGREYRSRDEVIAREHIYQPGERPFDLTVREFEIAELAADGLSRDEVCRVLGIARQTSNVHYHNLFVKLGVHSQAQLRAKWRREVG